MNGYHAHGEKSLPPYLATLPRVRETLGGSADAWSVKEVGDGNLNLVFLVHGPDGSVCVKQALPYLRLVGEGWPLPLSRSFFESQALLEQNRLVPRRVPELLHVDEMLALMVMELLSPHVILRKGLIAGTRYPRFAGHVADFMARTLFGTSDLDVEAGAKKKRVALFCGNDVLCKITEDLIFTEPYLEHPRNRWTSPQLDKDVRALTEDRELKRAVTELKRLFLTSAEAMIHGDLHTGSIMVTAEDTRVIDPEFAFYGPMGFDVGAVIGNLLLAYYAQEGHATAADDRVEYGAWILEQIVEVWTRFETGFRALWSDRNGDAAPVGLFYEPASLVALQDAWRARIFRDSLGFAGAKMIRRIHGLAHVADMETIANPEVRARCERRALRFARELVVNAARYDGIAKVTSAAIAVD